MGNHIAFEPIPALASYLQDHYPSSKIYNMALGNSCGQVEFNVVDGLESWSGLKKNTYPGNYNPIPIKVDINSLDNIIPPSYNPYLIKIDVEGAEYDVFLGSISLLHKCKPFLVFENSFKQYSAYGAHPSSIWELLVKELGYRIFSIDGVGPLTRQHFCESSEMGSCTNYLAHQ
jgi:FkbM family methyltransferase